MLIENIKIHIEYNNLSTEEILNILNVENYNLLYFFDDIKIGINNEYYENINNIFSKNNLFNIFDSDDIENLKGFFSMLGRSDTNGQILNCDLYKKLFEKKYYELENSEASRCKSTVTLSIGAGLLFSIILI